MVLGRTYLGGVILRTSQCSGGSRNSTIGYTGQITVTQLESGTIELDFVLDPGPTCVMRGAGTQKGQLFRIPSAQYTCDGGFSATAMVYEMKATALGIEGRWFANTSGNCQEDGRFSAVF